MRSPGRFGDPTAGIPGRRLFVATPLPAEATQAVAAVVDEVRAAALPDGARDVRWVRMDGLHLTLRFIGPTLDDRLPHAIAAVLAVAADSGPIEVTLEGSGSFPPNGRPRALWIGVSRGADELGELTVGLNDALAGHGWPNDDRLFRPHLTLARSDGVAAGTLVVGRLASAMADRRIGFRVESLGLFESLTGGGPARYVALAAAPLGSPEAADRVYHQGTPNLS